MTLEDLSAADNGTVVTFSLKCPGGSVTEMFSSELIVAGSVVQRLFPILNVSVSLRLWAKTGSAFDGSSTLRPLQTLKSWMAIIKALARLA